MTPTASLPMYNLPEMRPVNAQFWEVLRGLLMEAGLDEVPETLHFDQVPVPERIGPEMLFSQVCGYPLETIFSGQAVRLGTPCYDGPGCDGPSHCGLFVVPAGSSAGQLRDLRGGKFLVNHRHSNSGMNLPRRALAEVADVVRPEAARQVRVLARTPPSPAIPFVTSTATPAATAEVLRAALREFAHNPRYAKARRGLMVTDIVDVPAAAYRGLLDYQREAAELGYPALARQRRKSRWTQMPRLR